MVELGPDHCLSFVERSPAAVAVHDKAAWLQLFARYNIVEDPVGSRPHVSGIYDHRSRRRGCGRLSRFWDAFIAPNQIRFEVEYDFVDGLDVVRDLTIEITMAPGVVVRTPMHLVYNLQAEQGSLKIFRLAAHWELAPMLRQQTGLGAAGLSAGVVAGWRLLRRLGPAGLLGFGAALFSIGKKGKERVRLFQRYFNQGNVDALCSLFESDDGAGATAARVLLARGVQMEVSKLIAAGSFVSCSALLRKDGDYQPALALFEFDRRSGSLLDFRCYTRQVGC